METGSWHLQTAWQRGGGRGSWCGDARVPLCLPAWPWRCGGDRTQHCQAWLVMALPWPDSLGCLAPLPTLPPPAAPSTCRCPPCRGQDAAGFLPTHPLTHKEGHVLWRLWLPGSLLSPPGWDCGAFRDLGEAWGSGGLVGPLVSAGLGFSWGAGAPKIALQAGQAARGRDIGGIMEEKARSSFFHCFSTLWRESSTRELQRSHSCSPLHCRAGFGLWCKALGWWFRSPAAGRSSGKHLPKPTSHIAGLGSSWSSPGSGRLTRSSL